MSIRRNRYHKERKSFDALLMEWEKSRDEGMKRKKEELDQIRDTLTPHFKKENNDG